MSYLALVASTFTRHKCIQRRKLTFTRSHNLIDFDTSTRLGIRLFTDALRAWTTIGDLSDLHQKFGSEKLRGPKPLRGGIGVLRPLEYVARFPLPLTHD